MSELELLRPNSADAREMEVFDSIPETDRQAWLYFWKDSQAKESLGIAPSYTFDQFKDGVAPHIPGLIPIVDSIATNGFRDIPLVKNFSDSIVIGEAGRTATIDPLMTAFTGTRTVFERARRRGPIGIVLPHTSLASPFTVARSIIATHGEEIARKINIVIGPRPAVIQFEMYSAGEKKIKQISPVLFGRALGNVMLTGPDTDSTRKNPELYDWLKELRRDFWRNMDELAEPAPDGDNSVIIYCPAGRVAEERSGVIREYRVDGSLSYLTKYPQLGVIPVGVFDRLLANPTAPESIVMINPDIHVWKPRDEDEAQFLHERAVMLAKSPLGDIHMESIVSQNLRLARQKVRSFRGKTAKTPYLVE